MSGTAGAASYRSATDLNPMKGQAERPMGHSRRVVITGMGVVTSLGDSLKPFWHALCAGDSGVGPLTLFDTTDFKVHFGGQVRDWDPVARFGVKDARHLDRFAQFALAAAESAVSDSGIDFSKLPPEQCGVFIGSGIGGLNEFETQHSTMIHKGPAHQSVHHSQADGECRQRPYLDPVGAARTLLRNRDRLRLCDQRHRRRVQADSDGRG